ncbi:MAG: class I SAM-dependent methyltransferase [Cyclobacteriaceae bacterium]|nr:class I SAM-dependent methyltransferase [Cyclobacteriaceae bacterium]
MQVIEIFNEYASDYETWFERHPKVFESEVLALREHMEKLPAETHGIEVGLGTGRFAIELGIKEGVEPAAAMRSIASNKGLEVMDATAERLPYRDMHFDFVMMITLICYLNKPLRALKESYRVLKPGGKLILGFIDKDSTLAKEYEDSRSKSTFYKQANFHTVDKVKTWLKEARFKSPYFTQTLYGNLAEIDFIQAVKEGHGEGSFVVVSALK